jgi:hypothetical protein
MMNTFTASFFQIVGVVVEMWQGGPFGHFEDIAASQV